MSKKVLILSGSPRKGGNSDILCEQFQKGAEEAGNVVEKVDLRSLKIGCCRACYGCRGKGVCATPDGRKKGEPLAEGCSPTHSVDTHGPTAVFKSVSKLPTLKLNGGVLLNQKLNPSSLQQERDIRKLILMLRTFFDDLKGYHVQYNVVDKETLLDAQKHPEAHRDLIVRVAGYSAFFNVLSTETQNDIIARTEHVL